jgi:hypothetical protein
VRLKEQAMAMGLIDTTKGTLPVAAKAQAAYALILKDTALQQGDVARTSQGLANQKKFLGAQVEDLSASFGAVFTPVMINLVGVIRNSVLPQMQKFIEAFKTLSPNAITTAVKVGIFAAALGPAMIAIGYTIKMLQALGNAFLFVTKRAILIPTIIALIISAFIKGNDASMSWGEAVFKLVRGLVIGFAQIGNAVSAAVNFIIKGYNAFQRVLKSGVQIEELGNLDFLIRGVDSAKVAYGKFSAEMSKAQQDVSGLVAQAKELGSTVGGSSPESVAGGADKAAGAIEQFKKRLDEAKQSLTDAKSRFDDFAKSVSGSIRSVLNFGSAASAETGTFLENLISQADKAKLFGDRIRTLISMGLNESAISQVLDAGAEAGIKIADEIIAGGATVVDQVNTILTATQSLADQVGQFGAEQFYNAGIEQGKALVQGVMDAIKAAGLSIDASGEIVSPVTAVAPTPSGTASAVDAVKKANTATKKAAKISQGVVNKLKGMPKLAEGGMVTKPTIAMIGEAGPEAVVPLNKSGVMGNTFNLTINAGMGADGAAIGRDIVDAIKRYERVSGPVFASA